ncbi:TIGR03557 family F420-dependent LLM class oxidoreductase [Amycolatopsis sp. PS_44_ISF1]|uniref:TIGR03557 family F420-dependent LLM class oxidoreductase n=1 Tax=Amycolatopsis sp. PS_44_ISF1 TaxID=2974917 RepID=UPI0028E03251|nr:TIGR03557 family F420-dependent LLM class oxidoreductase [Amycolatopsis sp. PS_44_ISF1]MDT8912502.1 TIGR03557 family F420-dependent LLM class oxidoreductase [Amycolatopsis sp. PS_44_ISF1]
MRIGYTLMTEQAGPKELVRHAAVAEAAGFDFEVSSDHYSPWLSEQGHAPYAWSVLGAVTQVTERVELMTYVTCPTLRYHPAVIAQKAATTQVLSDGRFTLGLGSGENVNEHVIGRGWPSANVRHELLSEAVQIIGGLFDGGHFDYQGEHFRVDSAKLWDLPERRVPIAVAVSGSQSIQRFAAVADAMVAVEPDAELCREWDATRPGPPARKIAQLPVSWGHDREAAVRRAHEQFRWFSGGWKVNAELPGVAGFAAATQYVREEDVAAGIACGPGIEPIAEGVRKFAEAGFTDVALVQIGGDQQDGFLDFAEKELLPALREI